MYCIEDEKYFCSTSLAMRYIGGKWKAVILIHLGKENLRYSELKKEIALISERTLSLQLKELEADGLITRTVHASKPPLMVTYSLTDFGRSLIPVLSAISQWGKVAAKNESRIRILE